MIKTKKDLTGLKFGRIVVIEQAEDYVSPTGRHCTAWLVTCSCGLGGQWVVQQSNLMSGSTKSCGCLKLEMLCRVSTKHRMCGTRTYVIWASMIQRCTNPNKPHFRHYGGRGITVCNRWLDSFEAFYEDMGECPEGLTLDRIDNNGNYEPNNCRWVDIASQRYNTRKKSNNTSGRTGVYSDKATGKWKAIITKDKKVYNIGIFATFEEAVAAREAAELELYGYNKD